MPEKKNRTENRRQINCMTPVANVTEALVNPKMKAFIRTISYCFV